MKPTWTKSEILITCASVAMIPIIAWLTALLFRDVKPAIGSLISLFLAPLICSALLV